MIACYCRVSSARQKTDSQKPEIRRWLDGNRIDPSTVGWFEDKETGKTLKRPAFDRLQKAIFAGTVTTVVVWKLDRISRGQRDGVNLLADWCERGVRVVAVTQQIDLSGAVGRMVASVLFGLAEIEIGVPAGAASGGDRGGEGAGRLSRPRAGHDQGPVASCPGTPWPRSHGAGDRHRPGRQPADGLPVPGHGTGVVIS